MKFKIIFVSFNILIIFSFLIVFIFPVLMFGEDYSLQFLLESWYLGLIFILLLLIINILYFFNKKFLGFLEAENWPELKSFLELKIFKQKKYRMIYIKMYINSCIAVSKINDIERLEKNLRTDKPKLVAKLAFELGLPYILKNDPVQMKSFFGEFLLSDTAYSNWIQWNYCFALLMLNETEDAVKLLKKLAVDDRDPVLQLLSLYMLNPFRSDENISSILEQGKNGLIRKGTKESMINEAGKQHDNIQILFFKKVYNEAVDWLFSGQEG